MTRILKLFQNIFKQLEESEFAEFPGYFKPLFHLIALCWSHSQQFRKPTRFILLLNEISNQVVIQVILYARTPCSSLIQIKQFLDPTELLKGDPQETIHKVETALEVIQQFKGQFKQHRKNLPTYFERENCPPIPWNFTSKSAFGHILQTNTRLNVVWVY